MQIFHHKNKSKTPRLPSTRILYAQRITHDPYIDWEVVVMVAFLVSFACIGLGVWMYYTTAERLGSSDTVLAPKKLSFDPVVMDETLLKFESRATERANILRSGYVGPNDPSL